MKILLHIILIFICFTSLELFAQDPEKPTAIIKSEDISVCESGDVIITIEFTGTGPFMFMYAKNGQSSLWSGTVHEDENPYTFSLQFNKTTDFTITRIYDNNYPLDPNNVGGSGVEYTSNVMHIQVDEMPDVNAGSDATICGYEYTLDGTISDPDHTIYWNDKSGVGTYSDINSPTSSFTKDIEGPVTFLLTEENGTCTATDEVTINFQGSPTAKLITSGEYKFCSTDALTDNVVFDVEFTGNAPFDYTIKNNTSSYNESSTELTDNLQYPVSSSDQYYIYSVTDVNGCDAPAEEITGTQIVTDLKPNPDAGEDQIVCGNEFALEAVPNSSASGKWTSNSDVLNFDDVTDGNTTVSSDNYQLVTLTWTETDNEMSCVSSDDVQIRFAEPPALELVNTEDQICDESSTYVDLNITNGNAPFSITFNDESNVLTEDNLSLGNHTLTLSPSFNPTSSIQSLTNYHFTTIVGNYGCETSYSDLIYHVYIDEQPKANAGIDQLDLCDRVINLNASPSIGDGSWSLDSDGDFVDVTDPYTIFTAYNSGEYNLKWTEVNGTCSDDDDVTITIQPSPYPVYAGKDSTIFAMDNVQLYAETLTEGVGTWSLLEGNATIDNSNSSTSVVTGMEPGVYRFLWSAETSEGGCPAVEDTVVITMRKLYETEGFSPNGDYVNEYFKIPGSENLNNVHFAVFDKFGKLKYEDTGVGGNHEIKWDGVGKGGEELPEGVYYYIFDADELSKPVKKYLVIKR